MFIQNQTLHALATTGSHQTHLYGCLTLIGPPRSGKTTLWRQLAEQDGYVPLFINPAICPPEDVGGIPVLNRQQGTARYSQPLIIPPELMKQPKVWMVIDELDKADPANQVPLLTLLAERRIRDFVLPEQWRVSAAMNEPKGIMEEALIERLVFLPYALPAESIRPTLKRFQHLPLAFYREPEVQFPERTTTRGALHYLDHWAGCAEWHDKDTRTMLVRGCLPASAAAAMLAELDQIDIVVDPLKLMQSAGVQDVAKSLIALLNQANETQEGFDAFMLAWQQRIEQDKTGEWDRLLNAFGNNPELVAAIGPNPKQGVIAAAQAKLDQILSKKA